MCSLLFIFQNCTHPIYEDMNSLSITHQNFKAGAFPLDVTFDSFVFTTCNQEGWQGELEHNKFTFKLGALRDTSGVRLNPYFVDTLKNNFTSDERKKHILNTYYSNTVIPFFMEFSLRTFSRFSLISRKEEDLIESIGVFPRSFPINNKKIIEPLVNSHMSSHKEKNFFNKLALYEKNLELSINMRNINLRDIQKDSFLLISYRQKGVLLDEVPMYPKIEEDDENYRWSSFGKAYKPIMSSKERFVRELVEYTSSSLETDISHLVKEKKWKCVQFEIRRPQDEDEDCPRYADRLKDIKYEENGTVYFDKEDMHFFQAARELFDEEGKYAFYYTEERKCAILLNQEHTEDTCYNNNELNREEPPNYAKDCDPKKEFCGHRMSVCIRN